MLSDYLLRLELLRADDFAEEGSHTISDERTRSRAAAASTTVDEGTRAATAAPSTISDERTRSRAAAPSTTLDDACSGGRGAGERGGRSRSWGGGAGQDCESSLSDTSLLLTRCNPLEPVLKQVDFFFPFWCLPFGV